MRGKRRILRVQESFWHGVLGMLTRCVKDEGEVDRAKRMFGPILRVETKTNKEEAPQHNSVLRVETVD